jgi:hypothetical protein
MQIEKDTAEIRGGVRGGETLGLSRPETVPGLCLQRRRGCPGELVIRME